MTDRAIKQLEEIIEMEERDLGKLKSRLIKLRGRRHSESEREVRKLADSAIIEDIYYVTDPVEQPIFGDGHENITKVVGTMLLTTKHFIINIGDKYCKVRFRSKEVITMNGKDPITKHLEDLTDTNVLNFARRVYHSERR